MVVVNARFLSQRTTGVQRYGVGISRGLKQRFEPLSFVAPREIQQKELAEHLGAVAAGSFGGHLWEQWSLPAWCRAHGSPLLVGFSGLGPLRYQNRIQSIHDLAVLRHPEWFSRRYQLVYRSLLRRCAHGARHLITVSEFSRREIIELLGIEPSKISVVHSAVSDDFGPGEHRRSTLQRLGISAPYILAVSSLEPRKNFARLIQAFRKLGEEVELVIVGASHPSFAREAVLSGSERVHFTGAIDDGELVDLYRGAELFAFPSLYEGFGLPPLEAMRCATPVVAAREASIPEICGDAAEYCDPIDVESIAAAMRRVLTDSQLRRDLRARGELRAATFSFERATTEVIEIIQRCL